MKKFFVFVALFAFSLPTFAQFDGVLLTSCGKTIRFHSAASGSVLIEQLQIANAVACPGSGPVTITIY